MNNSKFLNFIVFAFIGLGVLILSSCKDPEKPKAIISVVIKNESNVNIPVEGATVRVHPTAPDCNWTIVDTIQYTDASGQVHFEFEYEMILDVEAEKQYSVDPPLYFSGVGILILKEDETYPETIILSVESDLSIF